MADFVAANKRNLLFAVLLIAAVSVFYLIRGGSGNSVELSESGIELQGPEGFSLALDYAGIRSAALRDGLDMGEPVDGGTQGGYAYGTWENEEFGTYRLLVLTGIPAYILITGEDGAVTVFNYESARTTEEFYKALTRHLDTLGYSVLTPEPAA